MGCNRRLLVKGGQGRSARDVVESAEMFGWAVGSLAVMAGGFWIVELVF